ncbi:CLUMA_CG020758, isoform A [Clunio marinus]|uniref:CLUMA_CG020758, isoform A n=1 Tax=Clunio marinus TaxID=568069 RepID=A0A1J1J7Q6_9DIPT|nr:CLUMA_CG020758, isoform A [Clunio marinus]
MSVVKFHCKTKAERNFIFSSRNLNSNNDASVCVVDMSLKINLELHQTDIKIQSKQKQLGTRYLHALNKLDSAFHLN